MHAFFQTEVIFIDDGSSTDNSWETIKEMKTQYHYIEGLRFTKIFGKASALQVGFRKAKGNYVATLDADLQDDPAELKPMVAVLNKDTLDLISGWKKVRHDNKFSKNLPSKLFNWAARKTSGIKLNDFNCGIKVYKKDVVKNIELHLETCTGTFLFWLKMQGFQNWRKRQLNTKLENTVQPNLEWNVLLEVF